jgi:hypothetical protein
MDFVRKGDKRKYSFRDKSCVGLSCWAPGMYQHRSPMACGGSRNTGSPDSPCCLNRAHRGCPDRLPEYKKELEKERRIGGWKVSHDND